jgi:hypothetical protein
MSKIKPKYVTFKQAKWLKEKGLVANCKRYWVKYTNTKYKEMSNIELEDLDREIGIGGNLIIPKYEQHQVVDWLVDTHNIWVEVTPDSYGDLWYVKLLVSSESLWNNIDKRHEILTAHRKFNCEHKSRQDAYLAAFDYILNKNLI